MLSPAALYPEMTERAARLAGPVLELLTGSAGADLVHCAAETDRTGVVVAVPLRAAGVRRDAVVGDYRRTTAAMAAVRGRMTDPDGDLARLIADFPDALSAPEAAITAVLDTLDRGGGPGAWLAARGVPEPLVRAWRERIAPS